MISEGNTHKEQLKNTQDLPLLAFLAMLLARLGSKNEGLPWASHGPPIGYRNG